MISKFANIISLYRLTCAVISTVASVLNVWLIYDMRKFNPHIYLILIMDLYQIPTDISYYLIIAPEGTPSFEYGNAVGMWSGLASQLISNVMIIAMLHVVLWKSTSLYHSKYFILGVQAIVTIPCAVLEIIYIYGLSHNDSRVLDIAYAFYSYSRLVSTFIGVIAYFAISIVSRRLFPSNTSDHVAVRTLIARLKYYPLLQAVQRGVYCIYYYRYGKIIYALKLHHNMDLMRIL